MNKIGQWIAILMMLVIGKASNVAASDTQKGEVGPKNIKAGKLQQAALSLPPELAATGKWEAFKTFWKKLDAIEPAKPLKPSKNNQNIASWPSYNYQETLSQIEQDKLFSELIKIFGYENLPSLKAAQKAFTHGVLGSKDKEARNIKPISRISYILSQLCIDRLQMMTVPISIMSRAILPASTSGLDKSIEDLENQSDLLIRLRKEGKIDKPEYETALQVIAQDVYLYAVLQTLSSYSPYSSSHNSFGYPPLDKSGKEIDLQKYVPNADNWIMGFEKEIKDGKIDHSRLQLAQRVREELKKLKALHPQLDALISDLEK